MDHVGPWLAGASLLFTALVALIWVFQSARHIGMFFSGAAIWWAAVALVGSALALDADAILGLSVSVPPVVAAAAWWRQRFFPEEEKKEEMVSIYEGPGASE